MTLFDSLAIKGGLVSLMDIAFQEVMDSFKCGPLVFICLISDRSNRYQPGRMFSERTQEEMVTFIDQKMKTSPPDATKNYQPVEKHLNQLVYETHDPKRFERLIFNITPYKTPEQLPKESHPETPHRVIVSVQRFSCRYQNASQKTGTPKEVCQLQADRDNRLGAFLNQLLQETNHKGSNK